MPKSLSTQPKLSVGGATRRIHRPYRQKAMVPIKKGHCGALLCVSSAKARRAREGESADQETDATTEKPYRPDNPPARRPET
ncbi:hypothetical protein PG990_008197 [Apiospora arundinis]|uniref:Uncharacterized protein n=1 Tax=Apiospora arundinis TaxID=335852 RepID=A0ABR2JM24_9PEZI